MQRILEWKAFCVPLCSLSTSKLTSFKWVVFRKVFCVLSLLTLHNTLYKTQHPFQERSPEEDWTRESGVVHKLEWRAMSVPTFHTLIPYAFVSHYQQLRYACFVLLHASLLSCFLLLLSAKFLSTPLSNFQAWHCNQVNRKLFSTRHKSLMIVPLSFKSSRSSLKSDFCLAFQ